MTVMPTIDRSELVKLKHSPAFKATILMCSEMISDAVKEGLEKINDDNPSDAEIAGVMRGYAARVDIVDGIANVDYETMANHFGWAVDEEEDKGNE